MPLIISESGAFASILLFYTICHFQIQKWLVRIKPESDKSIVNISESWRLTIRVKNKGNSRFSISSQVPLTTQPPFRFKWKFIMRNFLHLRQTIYSKNPASGFESES
jgi:hypothetical protein